MIAQIIASKPMSGDPKMVPLENDHVTGRDDIAARFPSAKYIYIYMLTFVNRLAIALNQNLVVPRVNCARFICMRARPEKKQQLENRFFMALRKFFERRAI